jgi:hypothetical protein
MFVQGDAPVKRIVLGTASKLNNIVSANKFQEIEDPPFRSAHFSRHCRFMQLFMHDLAQLVLSCTLTTYDSSRVINALVWPGMVGAAFM